MAPDALMRLPAYMVAAFDVMDRQADAIEAARRDRSNHENLGVR